MTKAEWFLIVLNPAFLEPEGAPIISPHPTLCFRPGAHGTIQLSSPWGVGAGAGEGGKGEASSLKGGVSVLALHDDCTGPSLLSLHLTEMFSSFSNVRLRKPFHS